MSQTPRTTTDAGSVSLAGVPIQLLPTATTKARARRLLARHHYRGDVRAVGVRQQGDGTFPAPSQPTFCRMMEQMDDDALEKILLPVQDQIRGPASKDELIVLDGKQPRQGGGHSVLTAVTVPSQHYLGSAMVDTKTNEIPVARELFKKLARDGRKVSLDALHTQTRTARDLVLEPGADYLLTVKDHQPTVRENIGRLVPAPPATLPPSEPDVHAGGPA